MEFSKGSLIQINADGQQNGAVTPMLGKSIKIGSDILSDVILPDNDIFCEISVDAFGKFFIKNHCKKPVMVNNNQLIKKRPLTNNSIIEIGNKIFKWTTMTSNNAASDPTKRTKSTSMKNHRKTTHIRVALFGSSNDDNQVEDKFNRSLPSLKQSQIKTPKNKENIGSSPSLKLNLSGIVQTSYSPASKMIGSQKKPNNVTPYSTPKTPISAYKTPMDSCSKTDSTPFRLNNSRIYSFIENNLIDLTTTPDKFQTPKSILLKSAIKNSAAKRQANVSVCSTSDIEFTTPSTTKKRIVNSRTASSAKVIAFNTTVPSVVASSSSPVNFRSTPKSTQIKRIIKTPTTVIRPSKIVTPQTHESLLHSLGVQKLASTPKSLTGNDLSGNNTLSSTTTIREDNKRRTRGELGTFSSFQLETDGSSVSTDERSPISVNSASLKREDEIIMDDDNVFNENVVVLQNDKRRTRGELGTYSHLQLETDGSSVSTDERSPISIHLEEMNDDEEIANEEVCKTNLTDVKSSESEIFIIEGKEVETDGDVNLKINVIDLKNQEQGDIANEQFQLDSNKLSENINEPETDVDQIQNDNNELERESTIKDKSGEILLELSESIESIINENGDQSSEETNDEWCTIDESSTDNVILNKLIENNAEIEIETNALQTSQDDPVGSSPKETSQNNLISANVEQINTPKESLIKSQSSSSPLNELSDLRGVKELLKTPHTSNITDVRGVKKLFNKSPVNDLTNVVGVKELLLKTPKNNSGLNDLQGVKNLFKTPIVNAGITDVRGVKELMATPIHINESNKLEQNEENNSIISFETKQTTPNESNSYSPNENEILMKTQPSSPLNELIDLRGVKELLKTPHTSNITDVEGVKKLFNKSPINDLTNVVGVKELLLKTPRNNSGLKDFQGVKNLFKTPIVNAGITDVRGVKELMATPKITNDLTNVKGVKELMKTPFDVKNSLENFDGLQDLLKTPHPCKLSQIDEVEDLGKTSVKDTAESAVVDTQILQPQAQKINATEEPSTFSVSIEIHEPGVMSTKINLQEHQLLNVAVEKTSEIIPANTSGRRKVNTSKIDSVASDTTEQPAKLGRQQNHKLLDVADEESSEISLAKGGRRNASQIESVKTPTKEHFQRLKRLKRQKAVNFIDEQPSRITPKRGTRNVINKDIGKNVAADSVVSESSVESVSKKSNDETIKEITVEQVNTETKIDSIQTESVNPISDKKDHKLLDKAVEKLSEVAPAKRGRGRKASASKIDTNDHQILVDAVEKSSEIIPAKRGRGRKASASKIYTNDQQLLVDAVEKLPEVAPTIRGRGRKASASKIDHQLLVHAVEKPSEITPAKRGRGRKESASKIDTKELQLLVQAVEKSSEITPAKRGRGRKASASKVDTNDQQLLVHAVEKSSEITPAKRGRGRKASASKVDTKELQLLVHAVEKSSEITPAKRGRGRKASASKVDTNDQQLLVHAVEKSSEITPAKRGRGRKASASKIDTKELQLLVHAVEKSSEITPAKRGRGRKASASKVDTKELQLLVHAVEKSSEITPAKRGRGRKASASKIDTVQITATKEPPSNVAVEQQQDIVEKNKNEPESNTEKIAKQSNKHKLLDDAAEQQSEVTPPKRGRRKANAAAKIEIVEKIETASKIDDNVKQPSQIKPIRRGRRKASAADIDVVEKIKNGSSAAEIEIVETASKIDSESNTATLSNKHKLLDVAVEQQSEVPPAKRGRRKANVAAEIEIFEKFETASKIDDNVKQPSQIKPIRRGRRKANAADIDVIENGSAAAEVEIVETIETVSEVFDGNFKHPSQIKPVRRGRRKASVAEIDVIENKLPDVVEITKVASRLRSRRK